MDRVEFQAPAPSPTPREQSRWIPVRSLATRHRARITEHLVSLAEEDRYLRFGYIATDEQIERYVQGLDFDHDEIFGVYSWQLKVVAMAHLAYGKPATTPRAEFGVSVLATHRGLGIGRRMLEHAVLHARNRDIDTLMIHALTENKAMLAIARHMGATISHDGPDSQAVLTLPPDTLSTQIEAFVADSAAEWDFKVKRQALRIDSLLHPQADAPTDLPR
jgi:GNAT superfamily N-acetyltransferase